MKLLLSLSIGCLLTIQSFATTYTCSSTAEILSALSAVQAGDEIIISSGTYVSSTVTNSSYFYSSTNGTSSNPITIRSASSSNKAHLQGPSNTSGTVLRIEGDYWVVQDLEISTGLKGLVFDNSQHSSAVNCVIHNTGNEAVHVRDGSDYTTIDGCSIYNTGNVNPSYGEGIYIGTDRGSWTSYDPDVDYTTVKNCTIGPNVRAEALDIKEGTQETTIEYNVFDGQGISGANYSDSFIDMKGVRTYVRYNTFNRNGESNINKGIGAIYRSVSLSSYEHAVHDNVFNMDAANYNMVEAASGTSEVYAWNNTRNPSGDDYNSRVIESCPSWYGLCGGNQLPTVSITAPQNNDTFIDGDDITITATASDNDGSVVSVKFYEGSNLLGEDTSSPYSFNWTNVGVGSYVLTAVATDDSSDTKTSSSVSIDVNAQQSSNSDLRLEYYASDTDPVNNKIRPYVKLFNDDSAPISYSDLTIRYWFTKDVSSSLSFQCDYADLGTSYVNGAFTEMDSAVTGADHYLEVSFDTAAGNLAGGANSGHIKLRITNSDNSNFAENEDYSYDTTSSSYTANDHITIYKNGVLVWGTEPELPGNTTNPGNTNNLSLEYYSADTDASNNKLRPYIKLINEDTVPVSYSDLKMRYWLTKDVTSSLAFQCDYADLGTSYVTGAFTALSSSTSDADHYLEVSFDSAAGDLAASTNSGQIKLRITNSTNSNFDESNDYSFDGTISSYQQYDYITLYQNDVLVWGTEPAGASARFAEATPSSQKIVNPEISVFPNPTSDYIMITTNNQALIDEITIVSLTGQEVYRSGSNKEVGISINTSSLPQGYYLVVIRTDENVFTRKIFKQ